MVYSAGISVGLWRAECFVGIPGLAAAGTAGLRRGVHGHAGGRYAPPLALAAVTKEQTEDMEVCGREELIARLTREAERFGGTGT